MHTRLASLLLAAALCMASPPGAASPAFDAMLRQAELVRSSDHKQFESLLGQLNASVGAASPAQLEQLAYLKAYHLAYTGRFDLGIEAARRIFDETADKELKFRAGSLMVNGYAATREFSDGLRVLDETLALIDDIDDRDLRHHGWTSAAVIYNQVGQYELGLHYSELVLADEATSRTACFTGYSRLEALYHLGRLHSHDDAILALIAQCDAASEPLGGYFLKSYLARSYTAQGNPVKAIALLEQLLPEIEATQYARLIGEIHSLLAEWKLAAGELQQAERHARVAIERSTGIVHSLPRVTAFKVLYEAALARGDTAAALENLRAYAEADKAYLDNIKARELAFQMVKHETLQKTQTIALLNNENRVLQLEQQVTAKSAQANRLLIALLAVLLASTAYWAVKIKKMQVSFRRLAETDALTGISNRHHFTRRAQAALDYCRKSGEDVGLVMLDLDNFKAINDQHGHATGDWALRQVAKTCQEACRKNDLIGRLGGEEFAFLLVGCDLAASATLASECRKRIAAIDTRASGREFLLTASFGVAGSRACGHEFEALLAQADDQLYRSKREGRDRVSVHADIATDLRRDDGVSLA